MQPAPASCGLLRGPADNHPRSPAAQLEPNVRRRRVRALKLNWHERRGRQLGSLQGQCARAGGLAPPQPAPDQVGVQAVRQRHCRDRHARRAGSHDLRLELRAVNAPTLPLYCSNHSVLVSTNELVDTIVTPARRKLKMPRLDAYSDTGVVRDDDPSAPAHRFEPLRVRGVVCEVVCSAFNPQTCGGKNAGKLLSEIAVSEIDPAQAARS